MAKASAVSNGPFYVALGDSLSVGIQPSADGNQLETHHGYVNDIYNEVKQQVPGLQLVDFGCPGDSTTTLLTGRGNAAAARFYKCDRSGGSQINAAATFLRTHERRVKLVTLDIGANDVIDCLNAAVFARGELNALSCVERGENAIATNLPKILVELRAAAPGAQIVDGTIYDPYVIDLLNANAVIRDLAASTLAVFSKTNQEISDADAAAGVKTAGVVRAFSMYSSRPVKLRGRIVPKRVAVVCLYTYMCAAGGLGPNIHPTAAGYRLIAHAYERELMRFQ